MRFHQKAELPIIKIGVGVASFLAGEPRRQSSLMALLGSFISQTYKPTEIAIYHDGPKPDSPLLDVGIPLINSQIPTELIVCDRVQKFGHPHRQKAINRFVEKEYDWILLTNDDNYYMPTFFEDLMALAIRKKADFVFSNMVHSHQHWSPMVCKVKRGHLDLGCFLVRTRIAREVPFDNFSFAGDADWFMRLAAKIKTPTKIVRCDKFLFVHN